MEERVASSAEDPQPQVSRPEPTPTPTAANTTTGTTNDPTSMQLAPSPTHRNNNNNSPLATYVVQVPKDQIYRVPPPENARIVENYRKAGAGGPGKRRKKPYHKYLIWSAVAFVLICVMIGVGLTILYNSFAPKSPVFSVSNLHVKKSADQPPKYDVTLKVRNRNENMGIKYGSVIDGAELTFWTKTLGLGQFPHLYQNKGDSNVVHVKLDGPEDQSLPPNIQRSMTDKKIKHQISLVLKFNSPLLMNVWVFKLWSRNMDVKCKFRVSTMGEGTKILSQQCNTKLS